MKEVKRGRNGNTRTNERKMSQFSWRYGNNLERWASSVLHDGSVNCTDGTIWLPQNENEYLCELILVFHYVPAHKQKRNIMRVKGIL